jgi:hypothetical protein
MRGDVEEAGSQLLGATTAGRVADAGVTQLNSLSSVRSKKHYFSLCAPQRRTNVTHVTTGNSLACSCQVHRVVFLISRVILPQK